MRNLEGSFDPNLSSVLLERWKQAKAQGDENAIAKIKQEVINNSLRFVVHVAKQYWQKTGIHINDLIGAGNLGLTKATEKFNPNLGNTFLTYAQHWIRAMILEYIRSEAKYYTAIAKDILESLGEDPDTQLIENLADESSEHPETIIHQDELRICLQEAVGTLSEREKIIIQERYFSDDPKTLREVAKQLGVSKERVRQIEQVVLKRLREHLENSCQLTAEEAIEQ